MVVLLIMGLLVSLGPIAFRHVLPGIALQSAAREMAAVFREARSIAIRDSTESVVVIDVDARAYRLGNAATLQTLDPNLGIELIAASTEQLSSGQGRIRFYSDGTSTGGRVTLTQGDRKYYVVVDWLTGRAEIKD